MSTRAHARTVGIVVLIAVVAFLGVALVPTCIVAFLPEVPADSAKTKTRENMRTLLGFLIRRHRRGSPASWPRCNGKNFVLTVVASGDLDHRNPEDLAVLFSPGDAQLRLEAVDTSRYAELTRAALRAGGDFSDLTSYAGRRNGEREFAIPKGEDPRDTPLIADLSFPDVVVLGYADGTVREVARAELGMPTGQDALDYPGEGVGETATSEIMRVLAAD